VVVFDLQMYQVVSEVLNSYIENTLAQGSLIEGYVVQVLLDGYVSATFKFQIYDKALNDVNG